MAVSSSAVSAQRLSASTEGTRARFRGRGLPYQVLNAFRHQRKGHAEHLDQRYGNLVEVLNAFRHQRKGHAATWAKRRRHNSAQRLSASTEGTRPRRFCLFHICTVLNAFRHQRKGHSNSVEVSRYLWTVLNAFRHQRKGHPVGKICLQRLDWCSTPFGINGRDTGIPVEVPNHYILCSTPFGINGRDTR